MKAVVLAGGFGTRLRPLSSTRPKPMIPVLGKPNLQYILEALEMVPEVDQVILSIHYLGAEIREFVKEKLDVSKEIRFVNDPMPLETGGALKNVENYVDDDFLVIYGDVFTNFDYRELIRAHGDRLITVAVTEAINPRRFGVLEVEEGRVLSFEEKPREPKGNLVDAGIYVVNKRVLDEIPRGREVYFEREILPRFVERGEVHAYKMPKGTYWVDLGTPEDLFLAHRIALDEMATNGPGNADVPEDVEIRGPVYIDEGARIGHGAKVGAYSYIGPGTVVGEGVQVEHSVLIGGDVIGERSRLRDTILGEGVVVGREVIVKEKAVIGDYSKIRDGLVIYGAKVLPWTKVEDYEACIRVKLDPKKVRPGQYPDRCPLGLPECIYKRFRSIAREKPPCDECIENQWLL